MDRLIKRFDALNDDDLRICEHRGIAYQADMTARVAYGADYLAVYDSHDYADSDVAKAVNAGRVNFVDSYLENSCDILDIGAASGAFVNAMVTRGFNAKGFDVIPEAADRLKAAGLFAHDARDFRAFTMWDSLEHMDSPEVWLKRMARGSWLFVSIPLIENLSEVRESKHYKPGEHLLYFTYDGFVNYMAMYGFRMQAASTHEVMAGRNNIGAFAFARDLPTYDDYVEQYKQLHFSRYYGSSATELHLESIASIVRDLNPRSILDYGCGRSDLVAHFWRDGERKIDRYDPAIREWRRIPDGWFDLAICCDVMEHIPIAYVDQVLKEIRSKSQTAIFTISTKLARAKLPDGSNAHCTILSKGEWVRWIDDYFGRVEPLQCSTEHELVLLAGKR